MPIEAAMMEDGDMKDTILEPQRQDELNRVSSMILMLHMLLLLDLLRG